MIHSGECPKFRWLLAVNLLCLLRLTSAQADSSDRAGSRSVEFPLDFNLVLNLKNLPDRRATQYRFHSFGNTQLVIVAKMSEGSLKKKSLHNKLKINRIESGRAVVFDEVLPAERSTDSLFFYDVKLSESGTYLFSPSQVHEYWKVQCLSGCGRPEISLAQFVRGLSPAEVQFFIQKLTRRLHIDSIEHVEIEKLVLELTQLIAGKNDTALSRFPSLPSSIELNLIRSYLARAVGKKSANSNRDRLSSTWEEIVEDSEWNSYPELPALDPQLPNVGYGHFISRTVPLSMMAQNTALGLVMTALAEKDGYELSFPGESGERHRVTDLESFITVLWKTGHHIELRDERSFANFLSFSRGEKYIRWPVWFKTGVRDRNNYDISLPAPHSQFVWQITGPTVNGRVNFFLGINGVGFFPKFDEERPQWAGFANRMQIFDGSEESKNLIKKATKTAELYLHRVRWEAKKYAKNYPTDGYGFVGICNDSSAVIESSISRETTFFPLFRSPELLKLPQVNDGLDEVLKSLPFDTVSENGYLNREESDGSTRSRVAAMMSYPYDPNFIWDKKLFEQAKDLLNP